MPVFTYEARDSANKSVKGTVTGDSPRQARQSLREKGLKIVRIDEQKKDSATASSLGSWLPKRRSFPTQVANFTGELATLLSVGVPLLEGMETLSLQHRGRFRDVILHLQESILSGKSLGESMKQQPHVFDSLSVKMVQVGENTGRLDQSLRQLSDFQRRALSFKDKVLSALLYPLVVMAVSLAVTIFLMTVVIPMLLENLVDADRPLPWPTMVLKFGSDALVQHGWWIAILLLVASLAAWLGLRTENGKRAWYRFFRKLPLFGVLSSKQEIARIALVISTLMKNGIEFLDAMVIAKGTLKNPLLKDALDACERNVQSGRDIGQAIKQTDYFPPMVTQVFSVGQKSGKLDEMLQRLAEDYDEQVETVAGRISTTIEPILILGLSLFVGFVLFATLLPIMEASNVL